MRVPTVSFSISAMTYPSSPELVQLYALSALAARDSTLMCLETMKAL